MPEMNQQGSHWKTGARMKEPYSPTSSLTSPKPDDDSLLFATAASFLAILSGTFEALLMF
jgi:hypothetical protein